MTAKTQPRLWAFRYPIEHSKGGQYVLWRGAKPRKNAGNWPDIPPHETFDHVRTNWLLWERDFEAVFPEQFHLPLGGGPVEIRFADITNVVGVHGETSKRQNVEPVFSL